MNAGNNLIKFEINRDNKSLCGRVFFFPFCVHHKKIIWHFLLSICSYDFSHTSTVKERRFNYGAWVCVYCGSSANAVVAELIPCCQQADLTFTYFFILATYSEILLKRHLLITSNTHMYF